MENKLWTSKSKHEIATSSMDPMEAMYEGAAAYVTHPLLSAMLKDSKALKDGMCHLGKMLLLCYEGKQKDLIHQRQVEDTEKDITDLLERQMELTLNHAVLTETTEMRTERMQDAQLFTRRFCAALREHSNTLFTTPLTSFVHTGNGVKPGATHHGGLPLLHAR